PSQTRLDENAEEVPSFGETDMREGVTETGVFETPYGPEVLTYTNVNGERIHQGDIILPNDTPEYRSGIVASNSLRWRNGVVPYESTGLYNDSRVTAAIAHWQERVPVFFVAG